MHFKYLGPRFFSRKTGLKKAIGFCLITVTESLQSISSKGATKYHGQQHNAMNHR